MQIALNQRDVDILNKQLDTLGIQLQSAQQDLVTHNQRIQQGNDIAATLTDRFTNSDLYQWMIDRISSVYFQVYTMAINAARADARN